ncbi:hypothetical protein Tco_0649356, partial [Tanacetum coccineum]
TSTKIVDSAGNYEESLLTTTYMYNADEQYDYIVRMSTATYVKDDFVPDDEDESEDTEVEEDKDDEDESEDG